MSLSYYLKIATHFEPADVLTILFPNDATKQIVVNDDFGRVEVATSYGILSGVRLQTHPKSIRLTLDQFGFSPNISAYFMLSFTKDTYKECIRSAHAAVVRYLINTSDDIVLLMENFGPLLGEEIKQDCSEPFF